MIHLSNPHATADELVAIVGRISGVGAKAIRAPGHRAPVIVARQVAAWLVRGTLGLSYPQTARHLGGRDHSTIIHACRRVSAEIARPEWGPRVELLGGVIGYLATADDLDLATRRELDAIRAAWRARQ